MGRIAGRCWPILLGPARPHRRIIPCKIFQPDMSQRTDEQGSGDALVEQQLKYCGTILTRLKRNSNAGPFLKPVDPVALGIPDYPEKIKEPMDISTIKRNLDAAAYKGPEDFHRDVCLMFDNCFTYNAPGSVVYDMGKDLQKIYESLYADLPLDAVKRSKSAAVSPRVPEKPKRVVKGGDMNGEDYAACQDILAELEKTRHRKVTWPFLEPVSEEDAPGYSQAIQRPMDLATMRKRLDGHAYSTMAEFVADLEQIITNCYQFNVPETDVYRCCQEFERLVRSLVGKQADLDARINELRKKISALGAELRELERQKSQTKQVFSLSDRERIGGAIVKMTRVQTEKVAEIVQRHCAYEYIDNDEIELNLQTIPDEVVGELNEYIQRVRSNDEIVEGSGSIDD